MDEEARKHLNPPKQSRSRRTLERIVRASLEILEREGSEALTVQSIVERADSSVGSFYARFAGKDDLLDYLGERVWREAASRWDEALSSEDWRGLGLRQVVEGAVRLLGESGRSRASYLRALERTPGAREDAYLAFQTHVIGGIEGLLLARSDEITHPEPSLAVSLGLRAVLAMVEAPPSRAGRDLPPVDRRMEEAASMLLAYLAGEGAHAPGGKEVDFFDIWG
jgi:AcrR family transcriptional regulator